MWAVPGEVELLLWFDPSTCGWSPPLEPGGHAPAYDTLRSSSPADFGAGATCVEWNDASDTSAVDDESPGPGGVFFYLIRGETCPLGPGNMGTDSEGVPRTGRACP